MNKGREYMYKNTRLFIVVCALVMSAFQLGAMVPNASGVNDFEPNVLVSWNPQLGDQRNSSVAVGPNGLIHVVWTHQTPLDDTDILYAKSIDGGATFIGHTTVHQITEGFQAMPDIAVSSNGWIHVVWSDNRQNPIEWQTNFIYYARSEDGGDSFEDEFAISGVSPYPSETTEMVQTNPAIDVDDDVVCTVHVAWNLIEEPVTVLWGLDYDRSDQCGDDGTFGTDIRVDPDGVHCARGEFSVGGPRSAGGLSGCLSRLWR
ncbi:MAG: hypothetical protein KAR39_00350 [Thermoplasmata archaeon]|nr:hypothetical protein [Thermoplasmata archaeon]